jgi:hypothetical protein
MTDDRTANRPSREDSASQREPQAASDERRGDQKRKPGPVERGEWRGSGVCGDRHTD